MRAILLPALAAALLLAGCSGASDDEAPGAAATTADGAPMDGGNLTQPLPRPSGNATLGDCGVHAYDVPVDAAAAAALMPDGFVPATFFDVPGQATGVFVVSHCASVSMPGLAVAPLSQVLVYVPVQVPAAYQNASVSGYRVMLRHGADQAAFRDLLASWNASLEEGRATVGATTVEVPPAPAAATSQDTAAGTGFTITATSEAVAMGSLDEGRLRLFYLDGRNVTAAVDLVLLPTPLVQASQGSYQATGDLPLFGASGTGYGAHYGYGDIPALRFEPAPLPAAMVAG